MNDSDDATTVFDIPPLEEPPEAGPRGRHARTRRVPAVLLRRPTGRHVVFGAGAAVVFVAVVGLSYMVAESWESPRPPGAAAALSPGPEPAEVAEPTGRPVRASASAVTTPYRPHRRVAAAPSPRAAPTASPQPTSAAPSPSPSRPGFAPPRTPTPTPTPTVSASPAAP